MELLTNLQTSQPFNREIQNPKNTCMKLRWPRSLIGSVNQQRKIARQIRLAGK
jgi:hypothetical protein